MSNDGDGASEASVADFYLSTDSTIDTGDLDFGDAPIAALDPDEGVSVSLEAILNVDPGTYWVGVCVRPVSGESNTENNCSAGVEVTVLENESLCDIVPLSCGAPVSTALTAEDCDDSPRGKAHYAKFHTFEGLSGTDVAIQADWAGDGFLYLENPLGEVVASNNDSGGVMSSLIEYTLDADGSWAVWATSNEPLETFGYDIELECDNVPVTDLVLTDIDVDPQGVAPGGEVLVTVTTANQGTHPTESTTLRYFLSTDATITTSDGILGTDPLGPLDGGVSTVDNILFSAPITPGIYYVGACVDAVEFELSTANNCTSGVQLNVHISQAITITAGLNDAWFNPDTDGQGFFFNFFPGLEQAFVGWFTFEAQQPGAATESIGGPDQRWLTAFGSFAPTFAALDLYRTSGGVFNSSEPAVTEVEDGTFDVSFTSCTQGLIEFDNTSSGISGEIPILRISNDNVALCEELAGSNPSDVLTTLEINPPKVARGQNFTVSWTTDNATACTPMYGTSGWANVVANPAGGQVTLTANTAGLHVFDLTCSAVGEQVRKRARILVGPSPLADPPPPELFQISEGLNDAWFNPETAGQGFFINVFPGRKEMFLSWFTYDTERPSGGPTAIIGERGHRWFTAFGTYNQNRAELDLEVTTGGVFNDAPPNPVTTSDGTIEIEVIDCENAIVNFDVASADLSGEFMIRRISSDNTELCEELSGATLEAQ